MATLTRRKIRELLASCLILTLTVTTSMAAVTNAASSKKTKDNQLSYRINSVLWEQTATDNVLKIKGNSTPTYTVYELFEPLRVIIDIANASIDPSVTLPEGLSDNPVSAVTAKTIEDKEPTITRIELSLRNDHKYTVDKVSNDILIKFPKSTSQDLEGNTSKTPQPDTASQVDSDNSTSEITNGLLATKLIKIDVNKTSDLTKIFLKADGAIKSFRKTVLAKNPTANRPDRIYIDLDNIRMIGPVETISVGTSVSKIRTAKRQDGIRVVFDSALDHLFDYTITKQADGLLVSIKEAGSSKDILASILPTTSATIPPKEAAQEVQSTIKPASVSETSLEPEPTKPSLPSTTVLDENDLSGSTDAGLAKKFKAPSPHEQTFAGYNKQRITVDFYKIDLHNVFRLFGDISNLNIVVDEAVNGSLTLALNDVPWDFALDIILNLKDLQKEERFNTIVISPKSKSFTWPERALDNVEFKSDIKIQQADQEPGGIKISKRIEVPEYVLEAKKLIHQANLVEQKGDYNNALALYEEAFSKWGDNINLARKITAMCLVQLGQNAKAVHYAKLVLKAEPGDQDAALHAAIGLARMKSISEAKRYFDLSVSGDAPPREALVSYATFCEEEQDLDCALLQLKRHDDLYGDNLTTMTSKARIYDKQGNRDKAAQVYQTIQLSGFELPPDLARYVKGRAALTGR